MSYRVSIRQVCREVAEYHTGLSKAAKIACQFCVCGRIGPTQQRQPAAGEAGQMECAFRGDTFPATSYQQDIGGVQAIRIPSGLRPHQFETRFVPHAVIVVMCFHKTVADAGCSLVGHPACGGRMVHWNIHNHNSELWVFQKQRTCKRPRTRCVLHKYNLLNTLFQGRLGRLHQEACGV